MNKTPAEWFWLVPVLAVSLWVHAPSLAFGFINGDDFIWWLRGRLALADPSRLFAPIGAFYRPLNTCTFAAEVFVFGTDPLGYHVVNLALHLSCGVLFWLFLRRFAVGAATRSLVVALWLCSPFILETTVEVANAPDLYLPICWLAMALLWPGPGRQWSLGRLVGVALLAAVTLLTKETAVVLPALVLVFDLGISRTSVAKAVRRNIPATVVTLLYLGLYFGLLSHDKGGYYGAGAKAAAKVPHALAAFFNLTVMDPQHFRFGVPELLSVLLLGALMWFGLQKNNWLPTIGLTFFVVAFLPYVPVGFMTSRYTFIPYLGFLMIIAAAAQDLLDQLTGTRRRLVAGILTVFGLIWLGSNLLWLRADYIDIRLWASAHDRVVLEAQQIAPSLPMDRALVCLRLENENPLVDLNAAGAHGIRKVYYQRPPVPYGLVDWPVLVSYGLDARGGPAYEKTTAAESDSPTFAVLGHVNGGFRHLDAETGSLAEEVKLWQDRGVFVTVIKPMEVTGPVVPRVSSAPPG